MELANCWMPHGLLVVYFQFVTPMRYIRSKLVRAGPTSQNRTCFVQVALIKAAHPFADYLYLNCHIGVWDPMKKSRNN